MVYVIEESETFKKLTSDYDKKKYCEVYVEGIAHLTYLEKYNTLNPSDSIADNLQPAYKSMLGISTLKNRIFSKEKVNKGESQGYKDFVYESKEMLNMITNLINAKENKKELKDFLD